jgi:hypothetical protein
LVVALSAAALQAQQPWQQRQQQRNNRDRPQQPQVEDFHGDGSVVSAMGTVIQMKVTEKQGLTVNIAGADVHVTGGAMPDFLQSGLYIEFVGEVTKEGIAKPIGEMTVISAQPGQLGLYPENVAANRTGSGDKKGADNGPPPRLGGDPGIGGDPPGGGRHGKGKQGGDLAPSGDGPQKLTPAQVKLPGTYTVRAQIKSYHGNNLTLSAGRQSLKATVDDNPKIEVDFSDSRYVRPGDRISVRGKILRGRGLVQAEWVKIDCAKELSGSKKHATKASVAKSDHAKHSAEKKEKVDEEIIGKGDDDKGKSDAKSKDAAEEK